MIQGKRFFAIRGYNKSGTNWLGRILNLHPQISCTGEFNWHRITGQLLTTYGEEENLGAQEGLIDSTWHRMDQFIKDAIVLACDPEAIWCGDRTPSHIEPSIIIGARVFNLIRDGRDVMVSMAYHFFNNPNFFPEFSRLEELHEPLERFRAEPRYFLQNPDELLASENFVRDIAFYWAETIQKNQEKLDQNPEVQGIEVRYEDLHCDTEGMRKRLYEFLEVDPELAEPLGVNTRPGFGGQESPNQFLRKGIVGDWRNYFTPRVQAIFNEQAGETLIGLGYVDSLDWLNQPPSHKRSLSIDQRPAAIIVKPAEVKPPAPKKRPPLPQSTTVDSEAVATTVELMSQARRVLAYGGLDGVVQRPMFDHDGGTFPHFAVAADGCRVTDSVGQSYIDWMNGWGPVLLGYNNPHVTEAIKQQVSAGPTLSLMHPLEVEVAQLLVDMVPCAEMVAFGKNGSDAINASLRIARAATKRNMILQCGFHGFHEWYTCLHPNVEGMPAGLREQVEPFPYNDLDALTGLLEKHQGNVAAVIMEPVNLTMPHEGYLEGVRELTLAHGCLLIFDEVVTAFRLANGGAQEFFGISPDLACVGKGMANGMPLSAVVGKRIYMQVLPGCGFGMTFRGETFSLAAAKAVLELLQREPVCKRLAAVGRKLRERLAKLATKTGVNCTLAGPDARMTFQFHECGSLPQANIRTLFLQECLKNGVIANGTIFPNYAHDDAAIETTLAVFELCLESVARAIESHKIDSSRPSSGSPDGPRAFVSNGFLELFEKKNNLINLHGWMLLEDGAADSIELVSADGDTIPARCCDRPDLKNAFPDHASAGHAGYQATLPEKLFKNNKEQYEFTIIAKRGHQVAFRCLVVKQNVGGSPLIQSNGPFSTNDGVLYI